MAVLQLQLSALTLLVLGVLADDANDTAAMNHLALVTDFLDGRTYLHCCFPSDSRLRRANATQPNLNLTGLHASTAALRFDKAARNYL